MGLRSATPLILLILSWAAGAQTVYQWTDKDGAVNYADQPPSKDVKSLREKRLGSANFVETSTPSYAMRKAQQDFPVTLYTAPACAAECKAARDFLGKRGVPYTEAPIEPGDTAKFKQVFGDAEVFVPAVTVGSQKQKGFDDDIWTRLLDEAGYPKFAASAGASRDTPPAAPKGQ